MKIGYAQVSTVDQNLDSFAFSDSRSFNLRASDIVMPPNGRKKTRLMQRYGQDAKRLPLHLLLFLKDISFPAAQVRSAIRIL